MTRPYLRREPGDPLLASDFAEVQRRYESERAAHNHTGGPRGPRLSGAVLDPSSDATVQSVSAQRLWVAGQDVQKVLERSLPVGGGVVTGDLEVRGALTVEGRLLLCGESPRTELASGQSAGQTHSAISPQSGLRLRSVAGPVYKASFARLEGATVHVALERPAVLLVQFTAGYSGPCPDRKGMLEYDAQDLPLFELMVGRDGRWVPLGGHWQEQGAGDPSDIEALLEQEADKGFWDNTLVGGGFVGGVVDPGTVQCTGHTPLSACTLARAGVGDLEFGVWVWAPGQFTHPTLYVTVLTELEHA